MPTKLPSPGRSRQPNNSIVHIAVFFTIILQDTYDPLNKALKITEVYSVVEWFQLVGCRANS